MVQVLDDANGALVPVLGEFGLEFQRDPCQRLGNPWIDLIGGFRVQRHVLVDQLQAVIALKG